MVQKSSKYWLLIVFIIAFVSCDKNRVFDQYHKLDGSWTKNDTIRFSFEQKDTLNPYNLFINIRNNNEYPFNNLFVIVRLTNPEEETKIDTLEYQMTNPDGSLMGQGFTDIKESKLWYQENFIFSKAGDYNIDIVHALRESGKINGLESVKGVTEVGFRIEKTK